MSIEEGAVDIYRRRFRRYGFRSPSAMMAAVLSVVAGRIVGPVADDNTAEADDDVAEMFDALSQQEQVEWGKAYKQTRRRE